jgi:peptidoglycan hydrolase-like protein with peptidoglycan-binding domain
MLDAQSMKKIQAKLHVAETGELDDKTQAALKAFQKKNDQPATGLPDFDTLRRLGLDPKDIYIGGTQRQQAKRKQ